MKTNSLKISPAEQRHLDALVELHKLFLPPELAGIKAFPWVEREWIQNFLDKIFIAEFEGKIVGMVGIVTDGANKCASIETLAVSEEYQGRGFGKELVIFAKEFAKQSGAEIMGVETFSAYKKLGFYRSCGFEHICTKYYRESVYGKKYPYESLDMTL